MANAENRYSLKRAAIWSGGIATGIGIVAQGLIAGPSPDTTDYKVYAKAIDDVVEQSEKFQTEKGSQAVILLEGVKEELEQNPKYKNAKNEHNDMVVKVFAGSSVAIVSLLTGVDDLNNYHRRRRGY